MNLTEHTNGIADEAVSQARELVESAGSTVADMASESKDSLSGIFQAIADALATLIASVTASGRRTAVDLGHEAQAAAGELRKVRLTTEPKKTGPDLMPGVTLLGGIAAGAALMYLFDPQRGRRRRALLRDQFRDLTNRAKGGAVDARRSLQGVMATGQEAAVDDDPPWARATGAATADDPSTTDKWGEQPQPDEIERLQIS